ncbi:hypothetical protein QTA58_00340 [Neorhizobium sp. CSC1952]|uniref:hypothetical protein n=1 Tax=Neorhizobium sp. CSC1952 TaxID=2978974 RepID=UPI0025A4D4E9|nr:hypothetical protein [Rhizobium sp. CSC1952]WJR67257.1 hypothetical protein QTA58_00340 [Rhizobium sp. CSC1952]
MNISDKLASLSPASLAKLSVFLSCLACDKHKSCATFHLVGKEMNPADDMPSVFGLAANCERSKRELVQGQFKN